MSGSQTWQDLNQQSRPLTGDPLVVRAWGLERLAHDSAVSRTRHACDRHTVAAVEAAITPFSQPFIDQAVPELVRRGWPLIYDFGLTSQAVSSTSIPYPESTFGSLRLNDQVRLCSPHLAEGRCELAQAAGWQKRQPG